MNTTAKPTPGPYTLEGKLGVQLRAPDRAIAEFWVNGDSKANAELALESFTVYHETGLTPRQLADALAEEKRLSSAISRDCNACALERNDWRDKAGQLADQRAELLAAIERVIASDDAHKTLHAVDGDDVSRMVEFAEAHDNLLAVLARAKAVPK